MKEPKPSTDPHNHLAAGQTARSPGMIGGLASWAMGLRRYLEQHRMAGLVTLLCIMAVMIGVEAYQTATPAPPYVDPPSALVAADLLASHRLHGDEADRSGPPGDPGRSRGIGAAPGYALVLFGVALLDPAVAAAIECRVDQVGCGEASFSTVVAIQIAVSMLGLVLVFATALRLSGAWEVALLTLILAFGATNLGGFSGYIHLLVWLPALLALFMYLVAEAHMRGNPLFALGSGMALGAGALFLPLIVVMAPAAALFLAATTGWRGRTRLLGMANAAALLLGTALAGLPLLLAVSLSYDPAAALRHVTSHLSERVAFQSMDLQTWLASLLAPVPELGKLAKVLFAEATTHRLGYTYSPGSYGQQGVEEIFPGTMAQPGTPLNQLAWLVKTRVGSDLTAYLAVTPSIVNRGIWGGAGVLGLFGFFHLKSLITHHRSDGRLGLLLVVFGPSVVLFLANTALTANNYWENPALVFLYTYAIAYVAGRFCTGQVRARCRRKDPEPSAARP